MPLNRPKDSQRRHWALIGRLRVLWLALALVAIVDISLPSLPGTTTSSLDPMRAFAERVDSSEVILVGSSRTRFLAEKHLSAPANGLSTANLSFNGGSVEAMSQLIFRFLADATVKRSGVKLLVLAVGPMDLNDARKNPIVVETWSIGNAAMDAWQHGLNVRTRTFLRRKTPLQYSKILEYLRRGQLRTKLRDFALAMSGRLGLSQKQEAKSDTKVSEQVIGQRQAGKATSLGEVPPPTNPATLRNFKVGGAQYAALKALVKRMRALGVTVALVHTPVSDWFSQVYSPELWSDYVMLLRQIKDELGVPVMVLPKDSFGLSDADYFTTAGGFDGHHVLSDQGRARFAVGVRTEVVEPIWQRLRAGQRVDGSLSRFEGPAR